jgi:hypothetical protein
MAREAEVTLSDPFVMGVDVARFGDDRTVIVLRRGRDARGISWIKLAGNSLASLATNISTTRSSRPGPGGCETKGQASGSRPYVLDCYRS